MKTKLSKPKFIATVFIGGFKSQLKQEWTLGTAASVGLYQGLKYGGNLIRGINGGLVTLAVMGATNGINNVIQYWDGIKKGCKEG